MIPVLAQVTADPSAQAIKDWLGVALYILGVIAAVLVVLVYWKQLREKPSETPQPFEVKQHQSWATLAQLETVKHEAHGRIGRERKEIDAAAVVLEARFTATVERLEDQIKANNQAGEDRYELLHGHINAMPQQIITILAQTGALKSRD
ncbi:MAG: hypothetical protein WC661_21300 [Opitutaceae bacterium]|jgi:hypothetical protein